MRAFYRIPLPLPDTGLPAGVELSEDATRCWVLADTDPSPALEAIGGVRLGARLSELTGADLDAAAWVRVQRTPDPDTGVLDIVPSAVLPTDTVLVPATPRTVFAGDAVEDYQ
jgi:hypothetical protein